MSVDTHVTCCAGQRLALAVRDVLLGLGVSILLGHTKVDHVDDIGGLSAGATNQEVIRFDIAVDEILFMDCLNTR